MIAVRFFLFAVGCTLLFTGVSSLYVLCPLPLTYPLPPQLIPCPTPPPLPTTYPLPSPSPAHHPIPLPISLCRGTTCCILWCVQHRAHLVCLGTLFFTSLLYFVSVAYTHALLWVFALCPLPYTPFPHTLSQVFVRCCPCCAVACICAFVPFVGV